MLTRDERDAYISEVSSRVSYSYLRICLDRSVVRRPGSYDEFIKDCLDNFDVLSFDFRAPRCDLLICITFENLAEWKHFTSLAFDYGWNISKYIVEDCYEI